MYQGIQVVGALSVISNAYCCYYVYKTFNIKICLNLIVCFDAAFTSVSSFLILLSSWILASDPFICSFTTFAITIAAWLFYPCNFLCAYIRYKRVSTSLNNQTWKTELELIKIFITLLITITPVFVSVIIINSIFEMKWINSYSACMALEEAERPKNLIWSIFISSYTIINTIFTFLTDLKTFVLIRRYNQQSNVHQAENGEIKSEIPMRASLVNFLNIFTFLISFFIAFGSQGSQQFIENAMFIILVIYVPKTPAMVFFTLRVNATNARIDQEAERERKRQLEIQDAKQRRNKRIARQLAMQEEGLY